jgi:K+-transporting ATPase ATPase C chain
MFAHLRANLTLLALTLLLCCVLYPLALWGVGRAAFADRAEGSLIRDRGGKLIASRLIAHEVKGDEYFQPRPSSASYNGAASGASNWAANNYQLRDRVARTLAPLVKYGKGPRAGQPVAPDIVKWVRAADPKIIEEWKQTHDVVAKAEVKTEDDLAAVYFDLWRANHPDLALEEVPADLVMASASGLDPHLTLKGALYQLPRVADAWAARTGQDAAKLRGEIEALLRQHARAPMFGLAGVEMVNVVEVNIALHERYGF